jgi:hypothetical protein
MLQSSSNANAFASTFYFFSTHRATAEKNKKSLQANTPYIADISANLTRHSNGRTEARTDNSTLAIGGVPSPLDSFVVAESSVLRTNFCAEKPAHRQSANRYGQA